MLLTGSYRRTIDDKHRIAIPKSLRPQLLGAQLLYLTPGLDGCLAVYPQEAFAALADRLAEGSPAAREIRDYSRLFYSQAHCVDPDRQARFRIPAELVDWAGLDGDAIVIGVRDHLEIWQPERWEGYVAQRDSQYDELAEQALGRIPPVLAAISPTVGSRPQTDEESTALGAGHAASHRSPK